MNCISPPEPEDKKLLAYLDGEADQETTLHLERCEYCHERARALARLHNLLTTRLYRITCPSSLELGEYHLRMLSASQMLIVAQHLRECPHCASEIVHLKDFLRDLAPAQEDRLLEHAKILIARLVGGQAEPGKQKEIGFAPTAVALRGEAKGPLTFEADGVVILLDIQPASGGMMNILGQVAADNQEQWTGALVELRQGSELQFSTTVDDLGAFRSEGIMPGSKELRIISKDSSLVVVSNFEVST